MKLLNLIRIYIQRVFNSGPKARSLINLKKQLQIERSHKSILVDFRSLCLIWKIWIFRVKPWTFLCKYGLYEYKGTGNILQKELEHMIVEYRACVMRFTIKCLFPCMSAKQKRNVSVLSNVSAQPCARWASHLTCGIVEALAFIGNGSNMIRPHTVVFGCIDESENDGLVQWRRCEWWEREKMISQVGVRETRWPLMIDE